MPEQLDLFRFPFLACYIRNDGKQSETGEYKTLGDAKRIVAYKLRHDETILRADISARIFDKRGKVVQVKAVQELTRYDLGVQIEEAPTNATIRTLPGWGFQPLSEGKGSSTRS